MKGRRTKYARARAAARWIVGDLGIAPTIAMAARTFDVSEYLTRMALLRTRIPPLTLAIDAMWTAMSPVDRDRFVEKHLTEIWDRIDHATEARDAA